MKKCKHKDIRRYIEGLYKGLLEEYCTKHKQFLSANTCKGCPDYEKEE